METTHANFTLQGRTAKARNNGTETDATVFSAFAARDIDSDTVHVGMNAKREGMIIYLNIARLHIHTLTQARCRAHARTHTVCVINKRYINEAITHVIFYT